MTLQRRADGAQDKHGLRSEPRQCELCGQLVVSVCDSLDMGEAVTCHYEPATEDEKAKRIAELEAELAALRDVNKRLNNDANLLMESNAQLTEENAALREDAAVGRAIENYIAGDTGCNLIIRPDDEGTIEVLAMGFSSTEIHAQGDGKTLYAALVAAGLMENTDGTD